MRPSAKGPESVEAKPNVLPQEYAYYDARNPVLLTEIVERLLQGRRIFLSGGAGTGKTTMVRKIAEAIGRRQRQIVLTASTGLAACQLR
ncbi:MAG: AAA family ATPase, partial [Phycisphaerales bacterium]